MSHDNDCPCMKCTGLRLGQHIKDQEKKASGVAVQSPTPPGLTKVEATAREDFHDALRALVPDLAERNAAIDRILAPKAPPELKGAAKLERLIKILDGITDCDHGEDCEAYSAEGPDADCEDRNSDIGDNPSDFLEKCDCGLKDAFEGWKIAKELREVPPSNPGSGDTPISQPFTMKSALGQLFASVTHENDDGNGWELDGEKAVLVAWEDLERVMELTAKQEADQRAAPVSLVSPAPGPIPMVLHCPECCRRHIDAGEFATKPHHTHACQGCGFVWRPAIGPTLGVQFLPGFKNDPEPQAQPIPPEAGHPTDHAFTPDSVEGESMCGICGWEAPNAES